MYMEDVDERKIRDYDAMEADSLRRHEIERDSDILRQTYRQRWIEFTLQRFRCESEWNSDLSFNVQKFKNSSFLVTKVRVNILERYLGDLGVINFS